MKLGLILLLHGVTLASTLVLSPANQLQSDLQASRFSAKLHYDSPLVPSDPTLANVIYFLGIVARSDFNQQLEANTYTSPFYPQIEITSHGSTEARYLLWGVYLAATDMVKYTRFNDVVANLFWDNRIVGQISLTATPALDLPSTSLNGTRSYAGESNTSSDLTDISSSPKAVSILNSSSDTAPALSTGVPLYALQSSRFAIDFDFVPGADRLRRTEVFLAFSAAIIHVAKFSTNDRLHYFSTRASDTNLYVHMSETGTGCLYEQVIMALGYVPMYMMEHPAFGYKETNFNVKIGGVRACRGSIMNSDLSSGRGCLGDDNVDVETSQSTHA